MKKTQLKKEVKGWINQSNESIARLLKINRVVTVEYLKLGDQKTDYIQLHINNGRYNYPLGLIKNNLDWDTVWEVQGVLSTVFTIMNFEGVGKNEKN